MDNSNIVRPDVADQLDWNVLVDDVEKPLRYLTEADCTTVASTLTSSGHTALAATYAQLASGLSGSEAVEDLNELTFLNLFWGSAA